MGDRLKDKVAIVTGAGSVGSGWGNGKAVAVLFAREGAKVLAVDVNPDAAEETRRIILEEGGECAVHRTDVSRAEQVKAMVDHCLEVYGRIDILHNNVGILEVGGPEEISGEQWDHLFAVNVKGMFLSCKYVLPVMERQARAPSSTSPRWPRFATRATRRFPITPPRGPSISSLRASLSSTRPRTSGPIAFCRGS